jgi:predicted pyridoxine 5'-phosphate oxidase superfamily flavin-nucleotide-binding protein
MRSYTSDIAFTDAVKSVQERLGSRKNYHRMEEGGGWQSTITPDLAAYLGDRDSVYLATASADGQPYIQHRGGAKGFLKVIDDKTLGFADFAGNRQYVSMGNLSENNKATLFIMDYVSRSRIKIWGTARFEENDTDLINSLRDEEYKGRVERAFIFEVEAWDANCPQHIKPRFTEEQVVDVVNPLLDKIEKLEAQLALIAM